MGIYRILAAVNAVIVGVLVASTLGVPACASAWAGLTLIDAAPGLLWSTVALVAGYFIYLSIKFAATAWRVEIEGFVTRARETDPV